MTDPTPKDAAKAKFVPILEQLGKASKASQLIPGFDAGAVYDGVIKTLETGKVDPSDLLKSLFGTGAAVGCAAAGYPALAPICAKAGSIIGGVVGGFFSSPPSGPGPLEVLGAIIASDTALLDAKRKEIFYTMSAKLSGDIVAKDAVNALLDKFFPKQVSLMGYRGGFYLPLYAMGCNWTGKDFSQNCGVVGANKDGYAAGNGGPLDGRIVGGGPAYGWQYKALEKLVYVCKSVYGVDLTDQVKDLTSGADPWKKWFVGASAQDQAAGLIAYVQDIKAMLWPALQAELDRRLSNIVADAALRSGQNMVKALDSMVNLLSEQTGIKDRKALAVKAAKYARLASDEGVAAAQSAIDKDFPPTGQGDSTKNNRPDREGDRPLDGIQPEKKKSGAGAAFAGLAVAVGVLYVVTKK